MMCVDSLWHSATVHAGVAEPGTDDAFAFERLSVSGFGRTLIALLGMFCTALAIDGLGSAHAAKALRIYMAPDGDDARGGRRPKAAIRSLARARDIARMEVAKQHRDIRIIVAPGIYLDQSVHWDVSMPNHSITIAPRDPNDRPIFDGRSGRNLKPDTWFYARLRVGRSNIHIRNLHIMNYRAAVNFHGHPDKYNEYNSHNRITGNIFTNIGGKFWRKESKPGFAAVHITNSRFNTVQHNYFNNIENADKLNTWRNEGALVHALYLNHFASNNKIIGNQFFMISGQAIKVRDFSNDNEILNNLFDLVGRSAYQEWYCGQGFKNPCTKRFKIRPGGGYADVYRFRECPSFGTILKNNKYITEYDSGTHLPPYEVVALSNSAYKIDYCNHLSDLQVEDFGIPSSYKYLPSNRSRSARRIFSDVSLENQSCQLDGVVVPHGGRRRFFKREVGASGGARCRSFTRRCRNGILHSNNTYNKAVCSL